ncbi:DinB family protein [uncultured Polaribacter sp.]|uniref:DinB family protein n=1 Tax=uncultured Polaribacter sp. TaxID=174711 RepID=UPI002625ECB6|nr:DinB family protein [uncultured Polaribacter sp.]
MINAIEQNLYRGIKLLNSISDEQYSNTTIPPYFSSIGCNMRHVLDAFSSIFNGLDEGYIDFTDRKRNVLCEQTTAAGISYFNTIITKLKQLDANDFQKIMIVKDDLGSGVVEVNYTLESVLAYAHSHAIHHYASLGFLIYQLNIQLPDADFGFNPTTPIKTFSNKN